MTALVTGLTFVAPLTIALVSRLAFIAALSSGRGSDTLFEFFDFQSDFRFGFFLHLLTLSLVWFY